jgi:hypothetical protein
MKAFFDNWLTAPTLWDLVELEHTEVKRRVAKHIATYQEKLPIDHAYLKRLCRRLGAQTTAITPVELLTGFLHDVPLISLWEQDFNAFLDGKSVLHGFPCICVHESIVSYANAFLEVVLPPITVVSLEESSIEAAPIAHCTAVGCDPGFARAAKGLLDFITGRSHTTKIDRDHMFSTRSFDNTAVLSCALSGCADFVCYREYGHLLMAHLEAPRCPKLELDADIFAWRLIKEAGRVGETLIFWNQVGAIFTFAILQILESIYGTPTSGTHPPLTQRVNSLLADTTPAARETLLGLLYGAFAVLNPTLEKHWNRSIKPH